MGLRGPKAQTITLSQEQREVIEQHLAKTKTELRVYKRCQVLLLSHEGLGPTEIADKVWLSRRSVLRILQRFGERGLGMLQDAPRPGRPRFFSLGTKSQAGVPRVQPPEGPRSSDCSLDAA